MNPAHAGSITKEASMGGVKLSAVMIALNEEKNLPWSLPALSFADELIVVDGGSGDRTRDIAGTFTNKVFHRDFDDFASQKNFAVGKAAGDWVLSVDADERVSPALMDEIKKIMQEDTPFNAYTIPRRTRLFGKQFRFSGLQDDRPVRLFRRGRARFEGIVHETLKVEGKTGCLKGAVEHESFQTLKDYWRRLEVYTTLEAQKETLNPSGRILLKRPFLRFLSIYVLKQGFRDGIEGFIYAALSSYYEFARWAKIWEKKEGTK